MAEQRAVYQETFDQRHRSGSSVSVTSQELEVQNLYPLFPKGVELPCNLCEKVMRDLGEAIVTSIQLDPETVASLVSLKIINDGQQLRNASNKSESERVLDYLCPAVRRGGNRALERLYQVLMHTKVGRMGHEELAKSIKRKVNKYISEFDMRRQSSKHPLMGTNFRGLQMYQCQLYDNLDFNVFGQAAEQSGFFEEGEGKRLAKLWQGDKEKAVSTLLEATEAKGPAGFGMFLSTLKCTLNVKGIGTTTQEHHKVLLDELSRVQPYEITVTGNSPSHFAASNVAGAGSTDNSDGVPLSQDSGVVKDILHRLEMLEKAKDLGSGVKVRQGLRRGWRKKENKKPTPQYCDFQEQVNETTMMKKEPDSVLMENEEQISRLQEQVRMLTLETEELRRTLQKREKEQRILIGAESWCNDVESAMKREIADLKDTVASLEQMLADSEEDRCLLTESEQKLAKTKEESKRYKAALNTCRKRIKSLEGTSGGLPEGEPPSVEGLVDTVKELCASLQVAHISKDVSQQRQKIIYFSLKDLLCQALTAVEQRLKDI